MTIENCKPLSEAEKILYVMGVIFSLSLPFLKERLKEIGCDGSVEEIMKCVAQRTEDELVEFVHVSTLEELEFD